MNPLSVHIYARDTYTFGTPDSAVRSDARDNYTSGTPDPDAR